MPSFPVVSSFLKLELAFVVIAIAAWYGWNHRDSLNREPRDEAVIENHSGHGLQRVRLTVAGQGFVREELADGEKVVFPFRVAGDGTFSMTWNVEHEGYEKNWTGGEVSAGPLRTRHHIQVTEDGGVIWTSEPIAPGK